MLSVGLWAPANAAKEAALIVAAQGAISPEPEAFSEAAEGANYSLAADAELIVMHYASCTESHFKGGDVTVGELGVKTTGELVSQTEVECPHKVAFAQDANAVATVIFRGKGEIPINGRPVFVLLEDGVERVEVLSENGDIVAELEVAGRLARWPAGRDALPAGAEYDIAIVVAGAKRKAAAKVVSDAGVTVVQP